MEQKPIRKRIVASGIVTALLGIDCLFLGVSDQTILVLLGIRIFLVETLFWGALALFVLGCFDGWRSWRRRCCIGRWAILLRWACCRLCRSGSACG